MTTRGQRAPRAAAAVLATALAGLACGSSGTSADGPPAGGQGVGGAKPVVVLETTMGALVVRLEPGAMPITTANFLRYVDRGFYDGTLVHRVVDDWVIQGGGYTPGMNAKTADAPIPLETSPAVKHVHGAISMARILQDPNSAASEWFICDWPKEGAPPQPAQLDGKFAAFGILVEGFDVLEAITKVSTRTEGALKIPETDIVVRSARRR